MDSMDLGLEWELKQKHEIVTRHNLLEKAIASLESKVARARRDLKAGRLSELEDFNCSAHSAMISRLTRELKHLQEQ